MDETTAAHKITSFFVKHFRTLKIGSQNIAVHYDEKPIFNIFNFSTKRGKGIQDPKFLQKFYDLMSTFGESFSFEFIVYRDDAKDGFGGYNFDYDEEDEEEDDEDEDEEDEDEDEDFVSKDPEIKIVFRDNLGLYRKGDLTREMLEDYFFQYILYVFANGKFKPKQKFLYNVDVQYNHPIAVSLTGLHQDETIYTGLTYVKSPVSTELTFEPRLLSKLYADEGIQKDKIPNPIFRFDTSKGLYTLWFSDEYTKHTIPVYEKEGIPTAELNNFSDYVSADDGYTMTEYEEDGNIYLNFGIPGSAADKHLKPASRRKIEPPKKRQVILCFVNPEYDKPTDDHGRRYTASFPLSVLEDYKLDYPEESMQLTKEVINTILTQPTLGRPKLTGGKKTRKNKNKKGKSKNKGNNKKTRKSNKNKGRSKRNKKE
jgi:hypothetical protein